MEVKLFRRRLIKNGCSEKSYFLSKNRHFVCLLKKQVKSAVTILSFWKILSSELDMVEMTDQLEQPTENQDWFIPIENILGC